MARPSRNTVVPNARTRMESAIWTLLKRKPYTDIRVKDVLAVAHTTKTSFYYHFSSLHDLTVMAISEEVNREEALQLADQLLAQAYRNGKIDFSTLVSKPFFPKRLERFTLLAGAHSTPELTQTLKDFMRTFVSTVLGIDVANQNDLTQTTVEFKLGGMMALITKMANHPGSIPPKVLIATMNNETNDLLNRFGKNGAFNHKM